MPDVKVRADGLNDTFSAYPRHLCIDQIVSNHAKAHPDRIALVGAGRVITYGRLEEESNRLAHYILGQGCGRESVIGLCIERSPEMIIAMLAILKAGCAYLPLDMTYPVDRLLHMIAHAECRMIFGRTQQTAILESGGKPVIDLDGHRDGIVAAPACVPDLERSSSSLAYVMYTSGTTGYPKGVAVQHFNISRLVINSNYVSISSDDVFLQLASIAFDASTFEIWGALLNAARLVLYDPPHIDIACMEAVIKEHGVSVLWLSAGFFNQVVETSATLFAPVKQLLVGGDVLSVSHIRKVMERHPGCQVINGYGPTECTTFSVCFRITAESLNGRSIPIGRPISNSRAYILDEDLRPVPPGEPGELCIGGDGLSRGYLGAPELTAEKFVTIPIGGAEERVYRTGDLVQLGQDGNIHFLGRADRQMKIRGFRVEPGEIEAAILSCPGVSQAVVTGNADKQGDKRLVAYVVGWSGDMPGSIELRERLRQVLPAYMVPATFVYLDSIPLTSNGKVDRDRLPAPDWKPLATHARDTARTPIEKGLQAIWLEVLGSGMERTITRSLSDLGGRREDLDRIIESIRVQFSIEIDQRNFEEESVTVASMANFVRKGLSINQIKE